MTAYVTAKMGEFPHSITLSIKVGSITYWHLNLSAVRARNVVDYLYFSDHDVEYVDCDRFALRRLN